MKAILIINKPTECVDCPCVIESEGSYWCNAECKDVTTEAYEGIPKWCPLKPMPKKTGQKPYCRTKQECVNLGWDACIDVITGEQNEL